MPAPYIIGDTATVARRKSGPQVVHVAGHFDPRVRRERSHLVRRVLAGDDEAGIRPAMPHDAA